MTVRACSTCSRWLSTFHPPTNVDGDDRFRFLFGECSLAGDAELQEKDDVMLTFESHEMGKAVFTRCDFSCAWWEAKP